MATITRKNTTPAPAMVQVRDLTGGLDRRLEPSQANPERARRLRNARISTVGAWQPRPGWASWWTTDLGAGRIQGAARVYLTGVTPFTLSAFGGDVYQPSDAGVLGSTVLTGLSSTNDIFFPFDDELVAVFDGLNVPQKSTDGTTWTQMGLSTPSVAPTASAGIAGGSLVDTDVYEFSYSYAQVAGTTYPVAESNEGATVTQAVAAPNLKVRVVVTGTADPQVDTINVYARDTSAGEGVRRFAASIANPGATTANVDITANNWSAAIEAPTRKNVPPALDFGVPWKNRWWARESANHARLRFSEIFENQSWPTLYYVTIPFTRGDEIAAIIPLGDVLVVFGRSKQAFLIIGTTSLDFEVRPSAVAQAGCLGPRAADILDTGVVHASAQGVYVFDGAADRLLTYDIQEDWREMVATTSEANLYRLPVTVHRRDQEVRIGAVTLPMYGTPGEWILDLARTRVEDIPAWATTDRPVGGYVQWDGVEATTGDQGRIFSWLQTTAVMQEESTGTSANGADLVADYESPDFLVGPVLARFTLFYLEAEPNAGAFGLEFFADGLSVLSGSVDIGAGLSRYGTATYGHGTYAGGSRRTFPVELPLEAEGQTLRVRGQYEGQATWKWFGYGFTAIPEPAVRGF